MLCCKSVLRIRIQSGRWIRIRIRNLNPDQEDKNERKLRNFKFWSARCSLLRVEYFSCIYDVLYGGLGISKLQVLIKKYQTFLNFWSSKPWTRTRTDISLKYWIRIRNQRIRIRNTAVSSLTFSEFSSRRKKRKAIKIYYCEMLLATRENPPWKREEI
jgi:hypothetical protein